MNGAQGNRRIRRPRSASAGGQPRRRLLGSVLGALLSVGASACEADTPRSSSESHWLKCEEDATCQSVDPNATCNGGYCEDARGERLTVEDGEADSASMDATGGAPPSMAPTTHANGGAGETPVTNGTGRSGDGMDGNGAAAATPPNAGNGGTPGPEAPGTDTPDAGPMTSEDCEELPAPLAAKQTHAGDYLVTDAASVDAAQNLTAISGDLMIGARGVDELDTVTLPYLEAVDGTVSLESSAITVLRLPNLREVGTDLRISLNVDVVEVDARSLQTIAGAVSVSNNPNLARLRLDALDSVGGALDVDAPEVAACELESLFDRLGRSSVPSAQSDCDCAIVCGWLEATCSL